MVSNHQKMLFYTRCLSKGGLRRHKSSE